MWPWLDSFQNLLAAKLVTLGLDGIVRPCSSSSWPCLVASCCPGRWRCFGISSSLDMPRHPMAGSDQNDTGIWPLNALNPPFRICWVLRKKHDLLFTQYIFKCIFWDEPIHPVKSLVFSMAEKSAVPTAGGQGIPYDHWREPREALQYPGDAGAPNCPSMGLLEMIRIPSRHHGCFNTKSWSWLGWWLGYMILKRSI